MSNDKILIPCRVCGGKPEPVKWLNQVLMFRGRVMNVGRYTRFKCSCGIIGPEALGGVKAARSKWNDENLDAHLQRQLIDAQGKQ